MAPEWCAGRSLKNAHNAALREPISLTICNRHIEIRSGSWAVRAGMQLRCGRSKPILANVHVGTKRPRFVRAHVRNIHFARGELVDDIAPDAVIIVAGFERASLRAAGPCAGGTTSCPSAHCRHPPLYLSLGAPLSRSALERAGILPKSSYARLAASEGAGTAPKSVTESTVPATMSTVASTPSIGLTL